MKDTNRSDAEVSVEKTEKQAYASPKVESVQLSKEAAEALT